MLFVRVVIDLYIYMFTVKFWYSRAHIRATKFFTVEGKAIPLQAWAGP